MPQGPAARIADLVQHPIITVIAVGPPVKTGGNGCCTRSAILAAGPCGIFTPPIAF